MTGDRPSPPPEPGDVAARRPGAEDAWATDPTARIARAGRGRVDRSLAYGLAAAAVAAAALFVLAGPLSVDTGLLVVGAAAGWLVGIAVRAGTARARVPAGPGARTTTAVALVLVACAVAWAGTWAWSHVQGGVLGPVDFLAQVYGLLVPAQLAFATAGAAIGSR